jgi:hypothetical protein
MAPASKRSFRHTVEKGTHGQSIPIKKFSGAISTHRNSPRGRPELLGVQVEEADNKKNSDKAEDI